MATDRQDIDALLIGALYGELDGAERTRLDAHLASHPQDRSALDGMRSTRAMLRDAELVAMLGAAEPPPAISARLLQEAARRAPAPAAAGGLWAFIMSLFRPLVASPALSAAAALVLVAGTAGVLYSRGSFSASEPTVGHRADSTEGSLRQQDQGLAAASGGDSAAAAPGAGSVDDYRVFLDEAQGQAAGTAAIAGDDLTAGRNTALKDSTESANAAFELAKRDSTVEGLAAAQQTKEQFGYLDGKDKAAKKNMGPSTATATKGAGSTRADYMAVAPADAPKVLTADGEADADAGKKAEVERKNVATDKSRGAGSTAAVNEGRAPAEPTPAPPPSAPQKSQVARDVGQGKTSGTYDPAAAAALDTWARDQHARMVKFVNAGKCTDAGAIGAEIARRAPDYYQANVANDRQVRSCRSYVDRARRAKSEDAKTKAAAPRSPAPDVQQDLESPAAR